MTDDGSPGSHPHSDRPNWQPAETIADYARNIRVGSFHTKTLLPRRGYHDRPIGHAKLQPLTAAFKGIEHLANFTFSRRFTAGSPKASTRPI